MNKQRVLSFVMAIVTLLSAMGLTAFAAADDAVTSAWHTFDEGNYVPSTEEQIANGTATKYTMSDGSCYIRDIGGENNNVAWLQNIYHSSYDKSPVLSYKDNGGKFTASADYYINLPYEGDVGYISEPMKFAIRSTGKASFQSTSDPSVTEGYWPAFAYLQSTGKHDYKLYLDTSKSGGWLVDNEQISYASDAEYIEVPHNTWFTIVIDLDLASGVYTLTYRDTNGDKVLGSAKPKAAYSDGSGWKHVGGLKNITLNQNTFAMGYMLQANVENPVSCVYMDNVRIGYTPSYEIEVDGKPYPVGVGGVVDLKQPGKQLAWATLTYPDGRTEFAGQSVIHVEKDVKITTQYVNLKSVDTAQVRMATKEGLRYLTRISKADFEVLQNSEYVKQIEIGTMISPLDIVNTAASFTKEGMGKKKYLDVRATVGKWYATDEENYTFAGSVYDIQEGNWNREFVGVGYVTLTFTNGQKSTIYATTKKEMLTIDAIAPASVRMLELGGLTEAQITMLNKYAIADEGTMLKKMEKDLEGLNVMVLGDSQFTQAVTTPAEAVWLNALAVRCGWNYTNLAIGGMTVSKPTKNEYNKESMYSWMFEQKEARQFWWGGQNSTFFTAGNPTGNPEDVDFIIFEGGHNDFGPDVTAPLGAWGEKDPATMMGAWQLITEQLLKEYPNATIIFYTPWEFDESDRTQYNRNIITMYEKYSQDPEVGHRFALADGGKPIISGAYLTDDQWRNTYSHDSFHLKENGMELVGKNMLPVLWKIMMAKKNEAEIKSDLEGLDVLAIGDSLFDGDYLSSEQQWIALLAEQNNWNLTNLGTDGWTVQYNPEAYADPSQVRGSMVNQFLTNPEFAFGGSYGYSYGNTAGKTAADVDLILLEGGTNDYGWNLPLGTVSDTGVDSLYGAYNTLIEGLLEKYPNAKVVLVTSWHIKATNGDRSRMDYVANAMKDVKKTNYADNDRVLLLDAGDADVSGIYMSDKAFRICYSKLENDLNHLNALGMKVMANNMFFELWKLLYAKDI